jgi:hypothetical protein
MIQSSEVSETSENQRQTCDIQRNRKLTYGEARR